MYALAITLLLSVQAPPLKQWLADHQWKNRLVLVYAPSASADELNRQRDIFASDPSGIAERDLLVRELVADKLTDEDQAYLKRSLNVSDDTFQVLLIGKDGGTKLRQRSPFTLKQLYSVIDGMYMRQQEMKKRSR